MDSTNNPKLKIIAEETPLYAVKMRAAKSGQHISGAERLVPAKNAARIASTLVDRALTHPRGVPDYINIKVEAVRGIVHLKALLVHEEVTHSATEGMRRVAELLAEDGITRIEEIMALFRATYSMRGAMLLDVDTLERLEPDKERGVRATYMDSAQQVCGSCAKNHFQEALVLATKVQNAPGIVAEICVSDDPDYLTGYVASKRLGYRRITVLKEKGDPCGGRIFLYRGPAEQIPKTLHYIEKQCVVVDGVPSTPTTKPKHEETRFVGIEAELVAIASAHLERHCTTYLSCKADSMTLPGSESPLLSLASNDYLGLATDNRLRKRVAQVALQSEAGSAGSRLTTGTRLEHTALEKHLAQFKGTESAIVFSTGYMANVGTISALCGKGDVVLSDELNHASIIDGCRMSRAEVVVYKHNDMNDLERKLSDSSSYRRRLVVSDAVFSMDGDVLDLPRFIEIARRYDAFSMIDEAHSTGVLGATGRGIVEHFHCDHPDITLGTLSKAIGSIGGFVCASDLIVKYLRNKARSFIFATALPPADAAAANEALGIIEQEPERVASLMDNARYFASLLTQGGFPTKATSAIVPIIIGAEEVALQVSNALLNKGILIPAIRYPTVARGSARLRAVVSAIHTRADLLRAATAILEAVQATTP